MHRITQSELSQILLDHELWLGDNGGKRANLEGADLQGVDLEEANLEGAYLQGSDLQGADLRRVNLQGTHLEGARVDYQTKGLPDWAMDIVTLVR